MQSESSEEGIRASKIFVALVTKAWLNDPRRRTELELAVSLGKPILLLVEEGLEVPAEVLRAATALWRVRYDDPVSTARIVWEFGRTR